MAGRPAFPLGTQIAADVSRRNAGGPAATDKDMRVVLANPLADFKCRDSGVLDTCDARLVTDTLLYGSSQGEQTISGRPLALQMCVGELDHLVVRCRQRRGRQVSKRREC